MKIFIASILLTFSITICQEAQITNIQAAQRTDGSQIVDIYYDLLPDQYFQVFTISLEVGFNNSFIDISTNIDGDIGQGVTPGNLKHIIWNVGSHPAFSNSFFENLSIRINGESSIINELPFDNMIAVESGPFDNCGTEDTLNYTFNIMEDPVTNAQYAQFLIEKLNANELTNTYSLYYEGDNYFNEGIYNAIYEGGAITWNGLTFIVEEGLGNEPVSHVPIVGAKIFANHYNLRLPTLDERRKSWNLLNTSEGIAFEFIDSSTIASLHIYGCETQSFYQYEITVDDISNLNYYIFRLVGVLANQD